MVLLVREDSQNLKEAPALTEDPFHLGQGRVVGASKDTAGNLLQRANGGWGGA